MAGKRVGKQTKIWIEGYHLSTDLNAVSVQDNGNKVEVGGFTQDMNYLIGRRDGQVIIDGYFNDDTNRVHDALKSLASGDTTHLVSVALGDNAAPVLGDPTFHLQATQATYDVNPDLNGAIAVHGEYGAKSNPIEYGILLADETVTANGNTSSNDNGASSSSGAVGYAYVLGLSAGDTITMLIEDSPNDSVWSTLITFTLDGSAIDAERLTVSGTVERYVRASWTVSGAAISFPIAIGFIRS